MKNHKGMSGGIGAILLVPVRYALFAFAALAAGAGCASFEAVETTPEAMLETIRPADKVRVTLRDGEVLTLRVWTIGDEFLRGRAADDPDAELVETRLDRIAAIEVERPDFKKAMLTIFLPAVIGVAVICSHQGCDRHTVLTATP